MLFGGLVHCLVDAAMKELSLNFAIAQEQRLLWLYIGLHEACWMCSLEGFTWGNAVSMLAVPPDFVYDLQQYNSSMMYISTCIVSN
jgi:hypothetical protein